MKKRRHARHRYRSDQIEDTRAFLEFMEFNKRQGREERKERMLAMGFDESTVSRDVRRRADDGVAIVEEVIDPDGIVAAYRELMDPYAHGLDPRKLSARPSGRKRSRRRTYPRGIVETWQDP